MRISVPVIDSHTEGEPTRVVLSGGPELGKGRLARFRAHHDEFCSAVIHEPRGSDATVGALLLEPADCSCDFGVIFFNNVGYLGMCGHGTIGLIHTLAYLGGIGEGSYRVETPVGIVRACREASGVVTIENVASWRSARGVVLDVDGYGCVVGDVAWGGNWFFLSESTAIPLQANCIGALTAYAQAIRASLQRAGVTSDNGEEIDHIELCGPAANATCDSRNFVLCPGGAYDRSPWGTGTSAHMACPYAEGKLAPGTNWRQEGILGTHFEGSIRIGGTEASPGVVIPTIRGRAHVTAKTKLILSDGDPFRYGIRA